MRDPLHRLTDRLARRIAYEVRRRATIDTRPEYAAIETLRARYHQSAALSACELKVWSQNGEDGVLAEIFSRIGVGPGFFVEFGVEDGVECNTRFPANVLGWSGVYYEFYPAGFEALEAMYANRPDVITTKAFVTPENVTDLFVASDVPQSFDLLSIDVDGQDYWIWEAIDRFAPRVVVIEYNSSLPAESRLVEPLGAPEWSRTSYGGASVGALVALGNRKGYTLVHLEIAGVNAFFVRDEYASKFEPPPMRSPNLLLTGRGHPPGAGEYVTV